MPHLRNLRIEIYEVLTGPRQDLFTKIREEARRLGVLKVWHRNGTIYARKTSNSSTVRIHEVADVGRLQVLLDFFQPRVIL